MIDMFKVKKVKLVCKNEKFFNEEFFCSSEGIITGTIDDTVKSISVRIIADPYSCCNEGSCGFVTRPINGNHYDIYIDDVLQKFPTQNMGYNE